VHSGNGAKFLSLLGLLGLGGTELHRIGHAHHIQHLYPIALRKTCFRTYFFMVATSDYMRTFAAKLIIHYMFSYIIAERSKIGLHAAGFRRRREETAFLFFLLTVCSLKTMALPLLSAGKQ
jgi:hypothetical protein